MVADNLGIKDLNGGDGGQPQQAPPGRHHAAPADIHPVRLEVVRKSGGAPKDPNPRLADSL